MLLPKVTKIFPSKFSTYSIKSLIENLLSELGKNDTQYKGKISQFLVDNNWFNIEIDLDNYSISDKDAQLLIEK